MWSHRLPKVHLKAGMPLNDVCHHCYSFLVSRAWPIVEATEISLGGKQQHTETQLAGLLPLRKVCISYACLQKKCLLSSIFKRRHLVQDTGNSSECENCVTQCVSSDLIKPLPLCKARNAMKVASQC